MPTDEKEDWGVVSRIKKAVKREAYFASTQRTIALLTAFAYFGLILMPLLFLLAGIVNVDETVELIKNIAAVLGGIVGMVWGFYFYRGE